MDYSIKYSLSSHLASYLRVLRNGNSRLPDVRLYKSLLKITGSAFVNSAFVPEYCGNGYTNVNLAFNGIFHETTAEMSSIIQRRCPSSRKRCDTYQCG